MPIADLLGVRFDMQLLVKLTASAAAIIFVTWVFRFYSSRARGQARAKKRLPSPRSTQASPETCSPCKTVLDPLKERQKEENDGENRSRQSSVDLGQGILQLQKTDAMVKKEENKELEGSSSLLSEGNLSPSSGVEGNMEFWDKAEREVKGNKTGVTLLTPGLDVRAASPSGRRSPCQLKKLDGGVEVGRELRQNMGHPGTFSSFQSKAEIKVENADLVIEGPGDQSTAVRDQKLEDISDMD
ncbi:hypothetical protein KOW79_017373 [Hemibagrus wyckioides]|uniref:Uncharacterized protein n=1 Tax=Hemibagrus wyckioides TaxID=337641 RepID=A0A9D3NCG8_9TELE|nr:hypothetical protein KOW79_017373 [Hemibagrus wyckioides]